MCSAMQFTKLLMNKQTFHAEKTKFLCPPNNFMMVDTFSDDVEVKVGSRFQPLQKSCFQGIMLTMHYYWRQQDM